MRPLFFALFIASGFTGLIYESIWTHYLKLFLGHAAYAQTLVLALFMGSMTVGAWAAGRGALRWPNLLLGYAVVEGLIGLCALGFHDVFLAVTAYGYEAMHDAGSPAAAGAVKWTLSALLILPQSVLMGMTFPLMAGALWRRAPERAGNAVALLYFGNSFGGAVGVLTSGFLLLEWLGLDTTMRMAGALNLLIALAAAALARRREARLPQVREGGARWTGLDRLLIAVALLTGLASFVYEVSWIRMLSMVLGASTHAFEVMLAAFILGLALGGLWIHRRIDRLREPALLLAGVQVAMGLLAASTVLTYGYTFDAMLALMGTVARTDAGYALFNLGSFALVLAVMLPATVCAGMTLPLLTLALVRRGHGEASSGRVYAANTLGALLGVGLAVHVGLPLLGLRGLLYAGCAVDVAAGLALLIGLGNGRRLWFAATALGSVAAIVLPAGATSFDQRLMAAGVYRKGHRLEADSRVIAQQDGKTATVHVTASKDILAIRTNGKADASLSTSPTAPPAEDEATAVLAGLLPLMHRPDAKVAANIGFGSGLTTHAMLSTAQLDRLDTIEIEPAMVDLARRFRPINERAYSDPRSRILLDDAKTVFATSGQVYDIVVSEPSNPWVSGVSGLFSVEFYRLVKRYIRPDGLMVQWIQLYEIDLALVASVMKALGQEFGDYALYAANSADIVLVATPAPSLGPLRTDILRDPEATRLLRRAGVFGPGDLGLRRIGGRSDLEPLIEAVAVAANSDFRPVLDTGAARSRFLQRDAGELMALKQLWLPAMEMVGAGAAPASEGVTPFPPYPVTKPFYLARLVRDAVEDRPVVRTGLASELIPNINALIGPCRTAPDADALGVLLNVAANTLPYLPREEAERFWLALRAGGCARMAAAVSPPWNDLLLAVARRDGRTMAQRATELLATDRRLGGPPRKYLVAAAMLGLTSLGDRAGAWEVWSGARDGLDAPERDALIFRLLTAHARRG